MEALHGRHDTTSRESFFCVVAVKVEGRGGGVFSSKLVTAGAFQYDFLGV